VHQRDTGDLHPQTEATAHPHHEVGALSVQPGVEPAPSISPEQAQRFLRVRRQDPPAQAFVDAILAGDRAMLSRAITLTESRLPQHAEKAQAIIEGCLPHSGASIRVGITGVPGVGKSTFIEAMGMHLIEDLGQKVAVLAVDPSSRFSGGSILGDKTRMAQLSSRLEAFIRPSPAGSSLGGVARRTREAVILCEAAGFQNIFIETVGVGQSETMVASMVDFFLLLMLAGAGDELQGIKRGIMEMADLLAINKADGSNVDRARAAMAEYQTALRLFPPGASGWRPRVLTCSALTNQGITRIWDTVREHHRFVKSSGHFEERRRRQMAEWLESAIADHIQEAFHADSAVAARHEELRRQVMEGGVSPSRAAADLVSQFFTRHQTNE
jgi:LAO/AO transport system kinase